ncbi:MAG: CoA-binding protein, partial [Mesorhizobium sp.]
MEESRRGAIACLMDPRSVAVVGATERPDASSFFVMKNLLAKGFSGPIHPVNPRGGTVFGLPAATALSELDAPPDVAVIGIAADRVEAALEEAGSAGVRAAVVLASGFAELDAEGRDRQEQLAAIARRHGMAICGPNCLGLFNLSSGAALYSSSLSGRLSRGGLAILSHSGASAIALANCGRFGLSHIVSAGNGAVTDIPDYMAHLVGDPGTRVIGLVVEAIRDVDAFAAAARLAYEAGKPVIALRAGRSADGARATAAHTGAVAGANEAWESFFRRCGVIEVPDMDGFVETAVLALSPRRAARAGNTTQGVAIVGVSGGGVAHVADIAAEEGLALAAFTPDTLARLKALLPPFASPQNPLDTTGIAFSRPDVYRAVLDTVAADPAVAMIVAAQDAPVGLDDAGAAEYHGIADAFAGFFRDSDMPALFMSNLSSGHHPSLAPLLDDAPVLNGTRAALGAMRRWMERPVPRPVAAKAEPASEDDPWARRLAGGARLTEREAKA